MRDKIIIKITYSALIKLRSPMMIVSTIARIGRDIFDKGFPRYVTINWLFFLKNFPSGNITGIIPSVETLNQTIQFILSEGS